MKNIAIHLTAVILTLAAIVLSVGVVNFTAPGLTGALGMFNDTLVEKGEDMLNSISTPNASGNGGAGSDVSEPGGSTASNLMISGPEFQSTIASIQEDIDAIEIVTTIPDLSSYTSFDVSEAQDCGVMAWKDGSKLYIGANGKVIANPDSSYLFANFTYVSEWIVDNIDTSQVTNMNHLFFKSSTHRKFVVNGLDGWDTSNVTNMEYAFAASDDLTCPDVAIVDLGDLSAWDTSNVTSMAHMFHHLGYNADEVPLGNLSGWDVSNVKDMSYMFYGVGHYSTSLEFGDLSVWDTGSAENMEYMFFATGEGCDFSLDLSGWNVSNVTNHTNFTNASQSQIISPFPATKPSWPRS